MPILPRHALYMPAALCLICPPTPAQGELLRLDGPGSEGTVSLAKFGAALDGGRDINGDGKADVLVGDPYRVVLSPEAGQGTVELFSGADGSVLFSYVDAPLIEGLGQWVANARDVDNDGVNDALITGSVGITGGISASIRSRGLSSLAQNEFALVATDGPPGKFLLFFYGPNQINTAFGDGRRCVGGNTKRLYPARQFDGAGRLERQLDLTASPAASGSHAILAGSSWNFQGWFRARWARAARGST